MNDFSQWQFVCFQLRIIDSKHFQSRLDMFDQDKTNLKNSAKMNDFSHWNFVCFQLRIYDNKHIQLRLDMFDQDKKDLKIMTGIESTNSFWLYIFFILFWWHSINFF